MFTVTEEERAAIRRAYDEGGEWAAVVELRRYFKIPGNEDALFAMRSIIGWKPTPPWAGAAPGNRGRDQ